MEFNPGFDSSQRTPEETQFVNLLKSNWILDNLEGSNQLTAAGTASLWASALRELKLVSRTLRRQADADSWTMKDIIKEYRRFDANQLMPPPMEVLSRLPDECFSIWVVEAPPLLPPDLAEQRPLEDQILELSVAFPDNQISLR